MKKKRKKVSEASLVSSPALTILVFVFCGVIFLAHLITSFFPHHRVWGINHLAYFPPYVKIIFIVLFPLIFIPGINKGIRTVVRKPVAFLYEQSSKYKRYFWYVAFSLLSFPLFWVLRSKTYFLGDGFNYVANLNNGAKTLVWSELLESLLHVQWYKFLNIFFSADGQLAYQIASITAGMIFVFLIFLFSDYMGQSLFEKFFVFSILATMGSIQLFFGYVEHYSFVYLSVLAYIFFAIRWLDKGGKLLFVIFIFVVCLAFHFASFYLLPSLAYLLLLRGEGRISKKRIWGLGLGLLLIGALFLLYVFESKPGLIRIFVLPIEQMHAPGYTLFSFSHLLDMLNENLLISPVGLILFLIPFLLFKNHFDLRRPTIIFLLLVTACQLLFHFVMDPGLGAPRDWDLFSALSLGYTILGLWLFLKTVVKASAFKYVATILVFTSFFPTLSWIALNASESKSVQRFRDILDLDPIRSRSGHFFLAQYFGERGMMEEMEREHQKQREIYPELTLLEKGIEYFNQGKLIEALDIFKRANQKYPDSPDVHFFLGKTYYRQSVLDLAEKEYKKAVKLKPEYVQAHIDLAKIYAFKGSWEEAIKQYKKVIKLGVEDPVVYSDLGKVYIHRNEFDKAVKYFQKAIQIKEDFVEAHLGLGAVFFKLDHLDEAITEYQKVIRIKPNSELAYLLLAKLYIKKGSKEGAIKTLEQFLKFSTDPQKSEEVKETLKSLKNQQ